MDDDGVGSEPILLFRGTFDERRVSWDAVPSCEVFDDVDLLGENVKELTKVRRRHLSETRREVTKEDLGCERGSRTSSGRDVVCVLLPYKRRTADRGPWISVPVPVLEMDPRMITQRIMAVNPDIARQGSVKSYFLHKGQCASLEAGCYETY